LNCRRIAIRKEIDEVISGKADKEDNVLRNAPHTATRVVATNSNHAYSREKAAYQLPWLREHKFWPSVAREDNVRGDKNLICACPPIESYADQ
jgi:glycine dehydrogenase